MDCSCRLELRLYKSVCLNIVSSIVMTDCCWLTVLCSTDPGLLSSIRSREGAVTSWAGDERGAWSTGSSHQQRGEPRTIWFTGEDGQEGALTSTILTIWFFKCFRELYSLAQQLGIITNTVDREKDILLKGFVYLSSFHSFYYLKIFQHQTRQGQDYDRKVNLETSIPGASV